VLNDYLRRHDGVITAGQARSVGLSRQSVNRRVQSGEWRQCARGVYFVEDRPFTDAARVRAAVWSFGEHAVASGLAAAWWHGLTRYAPVDVEVTTPRHGSGRKRPGARVRRRDLKTGDVVECRGLKVTALPLTALEAAVRGSGNRAVMDRALQREATLQQLWSAHLRNKGRHGSPAARILLQAADGTHSTAERILTGLLRSSGITGWRANVRIGGYVVDVAFRSAKVVIEVDGWAFHSDQATFQSDRERQNVIALQGWQVLRFTWLDLTEYPERVLATIKAAIRV
jgi:very-short-patch-repair endonuclease